ncbi:MAG: hypothetical protein JNG82_10505 [Opitutaceae bacterium]|nr:hypothetical protein [Opitutaceae bacterium]
MRTITTLFHRRALIVFVGLAACCQALPGVDPAVPDFSAYEKTYPWAPSDAFLAETSIMQSSSNLYEAKAGNPVLPDMFTLADGTKVTTAEVWAARRRPELLALFASEVYGVSPPRPDTLQFHVVAEDPRAMDGRATLRQVKISFGLGGETFGFHLNLFVPNQRTGRVPVFLLLNHRPPRNTDPTRAYKSDFWPAEYAIARGYAIAAINVAAEVDPDQRNATTGLRQFYRAHHPRSETLTWATLAAWAWSASRAVDYFETDPAIDPARIAVIGHSRGGKTALWAAAQDTRFALVCYNGAGEGGSSLARRNFGETLAAINKNYPHWFTTKYATYGGNVEALPVDTHELLALIAPRGCHDGEATIDVHADPRGSWLALREASRVWQLYGLAPRQLAREMPLVHELFLNGPIAYHMHEGLHDLTAYDWKMYFDHADILFRQ